RGRTDETGVLNDGAPDEPAAPDLPNRFAEAAARLKAAAVTDDGGRVDYAALKGHPAYEAYRAVASELAGFDPCTLTTRTEQLAFWINLFNGLAIDAVIAFGLRGSIRESPGFFRRAAYRIGRERYSAEQIEHGILRDNR